MAGLWTPERRARAAEITRKVKPWLVSTGPRTPEGKAVSAQNHYQGGRREQARAAGREAKSKLKALGELCLQLQSEGISFDLFLPRPTDEQLRQILANDPSSPSSFAGSDAPDANAHASEPRATWIMPPTP